MAGNDSWSMSSVEECLANVAINGTRTVPKGSYLQQGRWPVVDQGQNAIGGWTDDPEAVIDQPLPLVVFGDHTRALKYVDFPFARGADGTQLLVPRDGIDTLFFYYACQSLDLPSRGYNRHFTLLKEQMIPLPDDLRVQREVARALRHVEQAVCRQEAIIEATNRLKNGAMARLLTLGLRGEQQRESELGPVPQSWDVVRVRDHYDVVAGGTPSRRVAEYWTDGTIPWVKTTEVDYRVIVETEEKITELGLAESSAKILRPGTLLMAMYGQGVTRGKVGILGIEAACNQACAAMTPRDGRVLPKLLYHFLTHRYEAVRQLAHGGQQQNLNLDIVRDLYVVAPADPTEQQDIVTTLDAIDRKIELHRRKRELLDRLFKSLLHKLMTGEVRVTDLDLSTIPSPTEATP